MFPGLTNIKTNNAPAPNMTGIGGDNKSMGTPIATQNLGGDSLTQMMRSLQNYLATTGASTFGTGQQVTAAGLPGFQTAGDTTTKALGSTDTAMDTTGKALGTLDPAASYWSKLLSGDQDTMNTAIAPTATQASLNYGNAATAANQNMARGGFSGVVSAGLPQAQAREVNTMLATLQPQAAAGLNTVAGTQGQIGGIQNQIAGTQGNIAGIQGQLANWLSSLGIDISKLGLGALDTANSSLLGGRGQDVTEHGQEMSMASQLAGDTINAAGSIGTKMASPGK